MKPVRVDGTPWSAVVLCGAPGCGWREVGTSRSVVLMAAATHYETQHPRMRGEATRLRRRASELTATS